MAFLLKIFAQKKVIDPNSLTQTQLSRCLSVFDLTTLGIGSTLGAGIYVLAGEVARSVAGPSIVISFFVAGVASVLSGLCYAEFGARVPKAGSAYIYSYVTVGELCAFIIGWNLFLEYVIGCASLARAWSDYFDSTLNDTIRNFALSHLGEIQLKGFASYPDFFAFTLVLLATLILTLGVKNSSRFNTFFTGINLFVILFITCVGLYYAKVENWTRDFAPYGISGVFSGAATCFYAFIGFDVIATTGEEAKNPSRTIPISIVLALGICFLAYFGVSAVLTLMWPYDQLAERSALPEVFAMRGAPWAKYIIAVGALCGLSASLIGGLFPLPRMLYAMASDGLIFKFLAKVHPKTETPVIATIFSGSLAALLALIFDLAALVEMMSIGTLLAYTIVALCVLLLRYQPGTVGIVEGGENIFLSNEGASNDGETIGENNQEMHDTNGPTQETARRAALGIYSSLAVFLFASIFLIWGTDALVKARSWAILVAVVLGALLIASIVLLLRQPQNKTPLPFKVPCVPAIPLLSIFINIFLILKLSFLTWIRFAVWMITGLSIYIFYGLRHSVEGKRQSEQEGYVPLEQMDSSRSDQSEPQDGQSLKK